MKVITIRDLIDLLKKYPKYYKVFDVSAENGGIKITDEKGKTIVYLYLDELLQEDNS